MRKNLFVSILLLLSAGCEHAADRGESCYFSVTPQPAVDAAAPERVTVADFPLVIRGSYTGCANLLSAFYHFHENTGFSRVAEHLAITPTGSAAWEIVMGTPPGIGQLQINVRDTNFKGETRTVKYMIRIKAG